MEEIDMDFQVLPELTPEEQKKIEAEHICRLKKFYETTQPYSLESWYKPLAGFTFASFSFSLTNIEAYLLTSIYQQDESVLKRSQVHSAKISLVNKVNGFLKEHFPNGCFMKLSTRSPKDVGWRYQGEAEANYHTEKLTELLACTTQLDRKAKNRIYRYFLEESKDKVKVSSAEDFIDVFSHSQRIQIDLNDLAYLNNRAFAKFQEEDYSNSDAKLIDVWGRQWVDCKWMEQFRCFFHNYKLTAICQYDQRCYFQELKSKQVIIVQKISEFFQKILPELKQIEMSEGVMDLIIKLSEDCPVIMIQVNVFDHNTRASLFNWHTDLQILQNGPLNFRYLHEEIDISKYQLVKMMGLVQKGIEGVLNEVMKRLNLQDQWKNLQ